MKKNRGMKNIVIKSLYIKQLPPPTKIIHRLDKFTITKILNVTENYKNHGESTHCIYICKSFCKYFH